MRTGRIVVFALLSSWLAAAPAVADHSTIELVSDRVQAGADGANFADVAGVSTDGTRLFFLTSEPLVAADGDTARDLYQHSGTTTTLLSDRIQTGADANVNVVFRGSSADGTRVFFSTTEPLLGTDGDSTEDVYHRSGTSTALLSDRIQPGVDAAANASFRGASSTGTRVFFETVEPLLTTDTDSAVDVYQRSGGTTTLLSDIEPGPDAAFGATFEGASSDGAEVFFVTREVLTASDGDNNADVYQRAGTALTLISDGSGADGAIDADFAGSSNDGGRVFFTTSESLVAGDTDLAGDIYQRSGGATTLLSDRVVDANDAGITPIFKGSSGDGTRVFFETTEQIVSADGDTLAQDVYQRQGTTTTLLSDRSAPGADSNDGSFYTGERDSGTRVFFESRERLVPEDDFGGWDLFMRSGGTTTVIDCNGEPAALIICSQGGSSDGTRIFFASPTALVSGDTDTSVDIYEWTAQGVTLLTSQGTARPVFGANSADGRRVYFTTTNALVAADTDTASDIYLTRAP